MPVLSDAVLNLKPSGTAESAELVHRLRRNGIDVVDLTTGEPDWQPPEHTQEAVVVAMRSGQNKYTPAIGTLELREALVDKFQSEASPDTSLENVIVTSGGKQLLFNAFFAMLSPGDEAIIPAPYWTSFPEQVRLTGAIPVIVDSSPVDGYAIDPQRIAAAITPRTRLILMNSPNNPSGAVARPRVVRAIAELARQHDLWLVSDEIYEHLVYGVEFASAYRFAPERTLVANGASKGFAMTGWRIGYGLGPAPLISALSRLQGQSIGSSNSLAQAAVLAALKKSDATRSFIERTRDSYRRRRDFFVNGLNTLGLNTPMPDGAFYALADVSSISPDTSTATRRLAEEARVGGTSGEAFGVPGRIRFSYATSDEKLETALRRLAVFLGQPTP